MLELAWTRSLDGECPDCLLGGDRILLHRTLANSERKTTELVCFDLEGHRLWSHHDWKVLLTLPDGCFLLDTAARRPVIVNGDGKVLERWAGDEVARVTRRGSMLFLANERRVEATDLALGWLWGIEWRNPWFPPIDCFAEGAFYWIENGELNWIDQTGQSGVLSVLPEDLIHSAMTEYERTTGRSALSGWYSLSGESEAAQFAMGDRPFMWYWRISCDQERGVFFAANAVLPHLIVCLEKSGEPRWCQYLSSGCCGGLPYALPNGLYVASSGCGGILSWFDSVGNVLVQSCPHEGEGLATALSNEILVLADGRCLVWGGPGIVAYSEAGERLWVFEGASYRFQCDPAKGILVGCDWQKGEKNGASQTILQLVERI